MFQKILELRDEHRQDERTYARAVIDETKRLLAEARAKGDIAWFLDEEQYAQFRQIYGIPSRVFCDGLRAIELTDVEQYNDGLDILTVGALKGGGS